MTVGTIVQIFSVLIGGTVVTVQIAAMATVVALVLAILAGLGRLVRVTAIRAICATYIEVFRGTSLLVQLFFLFFVLPQFGVLLPAMTVAVLGIGLSYGAYGAEVVRGAVISVPRGQTEAGIALNMSAQQVIWRIVLPQAIVAMIPPWGNLLIQLIKATSYVSLITLTDLTFRAYQLNQLTMQTAEIFGSVLIIYFCLAQIVSAGTRWLESQSARWRARPGVR